MATDDGTRPEPTPGSRVFTIRLWKEELAGGSGYRGTVRDVMTDGFRAFGDWADLVAFMVARVEREEHIASR